MKLFIDKIEYLYLQANFEENTPTYTIYNVKYKHFTTVL